MAFHVSGRFHSHPKAISAGREAVGLWVLLGSWSAEYDTEGFVDTEVVERFAGADFDRLTDALVHAELWEAWPHGFQYTGHDHLWTIGD